MSLNRFFLLLALALPGAAFASHGFSGTWCGTGLLEDFSLKLAAAGPHDAVDGTLTRNGRSRPVNGSVEDGRLVTQATKHGSLVLSALGNELRIVGGEGALSLLKGGSFRRAAGSACGR
jgi:hypothetical protein